VDRGTFLNPAKRHCPPEAESAFKVRFAAAHRVEGAQAAGTYDGGQIIIEGAPVSMDREARITEAGDHRFFAGWRSDPFFFDVMGALNNFQFTGNDLFTDKDVCCEMNVDRLHSMKRK
jgi:hypothetical protein